MLRLVKSTKVLTQACRQSLKMVGASMHRASSNVPAYRALAKHSTQAECSNVAIVLIAETSGCCVPENDRGIPLQSPLLLASVPAARGNDIRFAHFSTGSQSPTNQNTRSRLPVVLGRFDLGRITLIYEVRIEAEVQLPVEVFRLDTLRGC